VRAVVKPIRTRIFSDLHYGDRASALTELPALRPALEDVSEVILNGDTLDTRPSPDPEMTQSLRDEVIDFFQRNHPSVAFLTGNHDPDLSQAHAVERFDRQVLVSHGDILFDEMVPWGQDATLLRQRVNEELNRLTPCERIEFETRLAAFRRAALTIPQRHQSQKNGLKYALGFLTDTVWPPMRVLHILRAWREAPERAAALVTRHDFPSKYFVMGHTHRLGAVRTRSGLVVLNTGSFCPPGGSGVVDITEDQIVLRRLERKNREYRLGPTLAEFALARA
jgi:predicted phosphodiesterase